MIIIKNSNISIGIKSDELEKKINEFELSDKTPIECMDFVKELKNIGKKETCA